MRIHRVNTCEGYCPFHNPSDHSMKAWPKIMRETGLIERACKHGIGHADPDSAAYMDKIMGQEAGTWLVHGCCGCEADPKNGLVDDKS